MLEQHGLFMVMKNGCAANAFMNRSSPNDCVIMSYGKLRGMATCCVVPRKSWGSTTAALKRETSSSELLSDEGMTNAKAHTL